MRAMAINHKLTIKSDGLKKLTAQSHRRFFASRPETRYISGSLDSSSWTSSRGGVGPQLGPTHRPRTNGSTLCNKTARVSTLHSTSIHYPFYGLHGVDGPLPNTAGDSVLPSPPRPTGYSLLSTERLPFGDQYIIHPRYRTVPHMNV